MIEVIHMRLGLIVTLLFAIIGIHTSIVKGQGICVDTLYKVALIKGKVLSNAEAVPEVNLKLLGWKDNKKTIGETSTDSSGMFSFLNVKDGKYILVIEREFFSTMRVPIVLRKSIRPSGSLLVHMAPDFEEPCSKGGIDFQPTKD